MSFPGYNPNYAYGPPPQMGGSPFVSGPPMGGPPYGNPGLPSPFASAGPPYGNPGMASPFAPSQGGNGLMIDPSLVSPMFRDLFNNPYDNPNGNQGQHVSALQSIMGNIPVGLLFQGQDGMSAIAGLLTHNGGASSNGLGGLGNLGLQQQGGNNGNSLAAMLNGGLGLGGIPNMNSIPDLSSLNAFLSGQGTGLNTAAGTSNNTDGNAAAPDLNTLLANSTDIDSLLKNLVAFIGKGGAQDTAKSVGDFEKALDKATGGNNIMTKDSLEAYKTKLDGQGKLLKAFHLDTSQAGKLFTKRQDALAVMSAQFDLFAGDDGVISRSDIQRVANIDNRNGISLRDLDPEAIVKEQYQTLTGQDPSQADLTKWTKSLKESQTEKDLVQGIKDTPAYFEKEAKKDFNETYYLKQNPAVKDLVTQGKYASAFEHFIKVGNAQGLAPNDSFKSAEFLKKNPDAAKSIGPNALFKSAYQYSVSRGGKG